MELLMKKQQYKKNTKKAKIQLNIWKIVLEFPCDGGGRTEIHYKAN